jgi:dTMP kinase
MFLPTEPRGLLIVFDGIDGTGKTTHSGLLAEFFREAGRAVVSSKEPTDGPWGAKLRATAATGRLPAEEELELLLRDRRDHVEQLIAPALAAGKVVILDRYYFSTMAYQGSRGMDPADIRRQNEAFAPVPDLLFILDLDVDTALSRIGGRGDTANEFEKHESLSKCRDVFITLAGEPFVHVIPTDQGPEAVQARIREIAADHL